MLPMITRPPGSHASGRSSSGNQTGGLPLAPAGSLLVAAILFLSACGPSQGQTQNTEGSAAPTAALASEPQERLPAPGEAWVIFGTDTVTAEVARTAEEREKGLMYTNKLDKGRGMLFVFQDVQIRSFWMENTLIPLDIAYLDESLIISDIQAMEPLTTDLHPSARPAMFALEVPMGWFAEMGISAGAEAKVIFGPG
jgi:uncharacterized membrane protein (UPF0127 family)